MRLSAFVSLGLVVACTAAPPASEPSVPAVAPAAEPPVAAAASVEDVASAPATAGGPPSTEPAAKPVVDCSRVERVRDSVDFDAISAPSPARAVSIGLHTGEYAFAPDSSGVVYFDWESGQPRWASNDGRQKRESAKKPFQDETAAYYEQLAADKETLKRVGLATNHYIVHASPRLLGTTRGTVAEDQTLWAIDAKLDTKAQVSLPGQRLIWNPRPANDGESLIFQVRNPTETLWLGNLRTLETRCLSGPGEPGWHFMSFDDATEGGRWVAFIRYRSTPRPVHTGDEERSASGKERTLDTVVYADRGQGRSLEVWVADTREPTARRVLTVGYGQTVVIKHLPGRESFAALIQHGASQSLVRIDAPDGQVTKLTAPYAGWSNLRVSPDGKWAMFGEQVTGKIPEPRGGRQKANLNRRPPRRLVVVPTGD